MGMFRNLVAYVDFATLAAIAVCVCNQKLCDTCRRNGTITEHQKHDKIFGGARKFAVLFIIWLLSFCLICPEVFNVSQLPSLVHLFDGIMIVIDHRTTTAYFGTLVGSILVLSKKSTKVDHRTIIRTGALSTINDHSMKYNDQSLYSQTRDLQV